ncbi:MAG: DUF21 domain-containing protein [Clostridia bacterium]|nr:DUF21 domain-containing protein [Clostridia bacterium]
MENDIDKVDDNLETKEESLQDSNDSSISTQEKFEKKHKTKEEIKKRRVILYSIRITILALVLGAVFALISEIIADTGSIIASAILLVLLILISIFFDAVGIAATSCDIKPLTAMASRHVYGAKTALRLVQNNSRVSTICSDLIGDTFGIVSGACATIIALALIIEYTNGGQSAELGITIAITAGVTALTIGGKSFVKNIAIDKSKEFMMFIGKVLGIFSKSERAILKKNREEKKNQKSEDQVE